MKRFGNRFEIQGINVQEICCRYGTPLYVYDADTICRQVETFREAMHGLNFQIKYAAKALTNLSILKLMKALGTGLDTVSVPEIRMGIEAGFCPNQIVFTPNCVDFSEIEEAVELGVFINLESLSSLEKFGKRYGGEVPCCLRLNPFIVAEDNREKVDWWHQQSKFGIADAQLGEARRLIAKYSVQIKGIHIHSSSVIMNPEVFCKGVETVFGVAEQFDELDFIDFGGGLKVKHREEDKVIDIYELGRGLKSAYVDFVKRCGRDVQLWFEPGRYLVSESGFLCVRANVVKSNGSRTFVGVDSGFNQLIRPMFYGAYHEVVNLSNPDGKPSSYTVVGNVCEIDNFAVDRRLPQTREGDLLAIKNAGSYGYMMASNYNSRYRPAEVLVIDGEARLIRRRDTYEDLVRNQLAIDIPQEALMNDA
ncbi:MAG: diaminopimelate decarboxylase [Cytophagales bacterium]|nr:diaminopimelate decarboxylase [Cytophagales bacterium]